MKCPRCTKRHKCRNHFCADCTIAINQWMCYLRDFIRSHQAFDINDMPNGEFNRMANHFILAVDECGLERSMEVAEQWVVGWRSVNAR